jgi:hypothetical protein
MINKFGNILLAFLACSCTVSHDTEKYQSKRDHIINVRDKIVEIQIEEPLLSWYSVLYVMDQYLIIQDLRSFDKLIHLFDRNSFQYITGIAYRGQGPGELANMGFLTTDEAHRRFYVSDHGKQKVFSYDLDSVLSDPSYMPQVKMEMNEALFPDYYLMIDDSTSIAKIIQPIGSNNFKPYAGKMNMQTGEITLMKYENPRVKGRKRSSIAASVEHGIYVEYYFQNDLMTICDFDGDLISNIYGPLWKEESDQVNAYYQMAVLGGDKIYASYLGGKSIDEQKMQGIRATQILVFDLQGNYLQTLETGLAIVDMCYDEDNHRLLLSLNDEIQFGYLDL